MSNLVLFVVGFDGYGEMTQSVGDSMLLDSEHDIKSISKTFDG